MQKVKEILILHSKLINSSCSLVLMSWFCTVPGGRIILKGEVTRLGTMRSDFPQHDRVMQAHQGPYMHNCMVEAHVQGGFTDLGTQACQRNTIYVSINVSIKVDKVPHVWTRSASQVLVLH